MGLARWASANAARLYIMLMKLTDRTILDEKHW
jgi:hypothetical protein